jgi:hypothetical protein
VDSMDDVLRLALDGQPRAAAAAQAEKLAPPPPPPAEPGSVAH